MVDAVLIAVIVGVPLVVIAADAGPAGSTVGVGDVVTSAIAVVLLLARRRYPLPVLAAALVGAAWSLSPDDEHVALQVTAGLVLYTVASTSDRRIAWTAGAASALALFIASIVARPTAWSDGENLELVFWTATATAVGDAVRSRRAYVAAIEERAVRAEQTREEEARRQVVEERLRIARELHPSRLPWRSPHTASSRNP